MLFYSNSDMDAINFIKLLRPWQWYKNLLVFIPILFSGNLFEQTGLLLTWLGFFALCIISSANYIINDIIDIKTDRRHPEKKRRPLASGKIKVWQSVCLLVVFLILGLYISWILDTNFLICVASLFCLTLAYSLFLKKEAILDIILIGINFVIRASSGAFIIDVKISPWLIVGIFFLSLFLSAGKRWGDLELLGKTARMHKFSLKDYSKDMTNALMMIATTLLVISYALYSFLSNHNYLIFTLPFALYLIFRYFILVYSGSVIARHPEKVFTDWRMMFGLVLWGASTFIILYLI